ncbi:MAG: fibronectin type III domain-containing protein [Verrucomicrobiota bacterium]
MAKLILNYSKLNDGMYASKTLSIVNGLTGNSHFPLPWPADFPTLAALTAKQKSFADAVTAAEDRDKGKISARNALRKELQAMVRDIGRYLQTKSGGDQTILESTGYDLAKAPVPNPTVPDAPLNLKVVGGKLPGSVVASAKSPRGARSFEVQYCLGDTSVPANWKVGARPGTCNKIKFGGLERAKDYSFRICAFGKDGPGPWSDVIVYMLNK